MIKLVVKNQKGRTQGLICNLIPAMSDKEICSKKATTDHKERPVEYYLIEILRIIALSDR